MGRVLRVFLWSLAGFAGLVCIIGALFFYEVYAPAPEIPHLSGTLTRETMVVDGLTRRYLAYVPRGLAKGAPLVLAMHGSGMNGAALRVDTGYAFERLADAHGFAVVYPTASGGDWNACNRLGDSANDVMFLTAIADRFIAERGIDRARVFAAGVSRGGAMALRLAVDAPSRFRAVAAVSASVPLDNDFKCKPAKQGTASVMIMNGTEDPINPFDGGQISLWRLFYKFGQVRSAHASGQFFADLNHIAGAPHMWWTQMRTAVQVQHVLWRDDHGKAEVELIAIHGGGHGLPQPYRRGPRILGPSPEAPNGAAVIWDFFARQRR